MSTTASATDPARPSPAPPAAPPLVRRRVLAYLLAAGAALGCLALNLGSAPAAAAAADQHWPQWRGPLATGVAPAAHPPVTWSETNHVKWKVTLPGSGLSTPIIWGHRIFIQTAIPTGRKSESAPAAAAQPPPPPPLADAPGGNRPGPRGGGRGMRGEKPTEFYQFALLCLDRATGQVLWQQVAREEVPHEGFRANDGSFASASPVTDGRRVFAYFGSRGLYAYTLDGQLEWSQDFGDMTVANGFGEGSSPALHGDTLVVNWDHEGESFIVALDQATGQTRWKNPRDERTSWSTPLIVEHEGQAQVIVSATSRIRSYDLASGKQLWECAGLTRNVIPCPVAAHGIVYAMSGFQGNALLALRLGRTGDLTGSDAIAWSLRRSTPYVPSPLLYGDRLYYFSGNNGLLSCVDAASGSTQLDAQRFDALQGVYASPLGAAGRVYLVGRNGATVVLSQADPTTVLATNRLDERIDASPAAVGNELYLRGHGSLYCLAEPAAAEPPAPREPDVIFVPTPQPVVEKMLALAEVRPGDVVYDLGCGDGRIVVAAARKYGVKAVGFDIDPERVREATANVRTNQLEHLATIRQADIFTLDLREATVVTLYLLPDLNVRLKPQLAQLRPGARIVSHDFDMRGAQPVHVHRMSAEGEDIEDSESYESTHTIYKWVVPWREETASADRAPEN